MADEARKRRVCASEYPARESFFAHRFVRLLTKTAAAQELGPEVTWLLTVIAHQEDAKRYSGPVTYWNEQLMPLCGFRSKGRLNRARQSAVESGWLHYETGGRTQPGRYWCLVPTGYEQLPDGPCDESEPVQNRTANGTHAEPTRNRNGAPSTLFPIPNPKGGKPADAGPSAADIEDVITVWNESGLAQCRKLTDKRRSALRKRLADSDWRQNWREALDRTVRSSFCRGENDRGWQADIDWFIQPDSVTRILEGKYDDRNGQHSNSGSADDVMDRHTADVLARMRAEQAAGNGGPA
ncbi:hypothetical protein GC176_24660 [bacterium]|nr:hypothetical protein [bacterium]